MMKREKLGHFKISPFSKYLQHFILNLLYSEINLIFNNFQYLTLIITEVQNYLTFKKNTRWLSDIFQFKCRFLESHLDVAKVTEKTEFEFEMTFDV